MKFLFAIALIVGLAVATAATYHHKPNKTTYDKQVQNITTFCLYDKTVKNVRHCMSEGLNVLSIANGE